MFLVACLGHQSPLMLRHQSPLKKITVLLGPPPVPQVSPGKYLVSTCDPVKSGWRQGKALGVSENCQLQGNSLVIRAYFYGELSQGAEDLLKFSYKGEQVRRNWGSFCRYPEMVSPEGKSH